MHTGTRKKMHDFFTPRAQDSKSQNLKKRPRASYKAYTVELVNKDFKKTHYRRDITMSRGKLRGTTLKYVKT